VIKAQPTIGVPRKLLTPTGILTPTALTALRTTVHA
jgi:hypothetical protein